MIMTDTRANDIILISKWLTFYNEKSFDMSDYYLLFCITMVKAHYVVITVQVDMNLIVICERIMELQPAKKMNVMMNNNFRFKRRLVPLSGGV